MALREILIELGIDVDKKGLKQADKSMKKMRNGLEGLKRVALGVGAVFLTGRLAQGFKSIVNEAGDATEILNKFDAVFGDEVAPKIQRAVDALAIATGQSRIAVQEMTADAGALVRPLLGSAEAAGDMAIAMSKLALDISSFENIDATDALATLRSALVGSSIPMLRFGVDTRVAALEQFALSKGITQSVKSMDSATLAALRMDLITKRLGEKGSVGDAEKTAGSYTNRLKALAGAFRDLRAEVGKEFIPIAQDVVTAMIDFARTAGPGLGKAARIAIEVFRVLSNVVSGLLIPFQRLDTALMFLGSIALPALIIGFKTAGIVGTLAGIKTAVAWVLAFIPLILFAALILLLIDDFVRLGKGSESMTGIMIKGVKDLHKKWGDTDLVVGEMLDTSLRSFLKFFGKTDKEADQWIEDLTDTLMTFWPNVIEFWKEAFLDFLGFVGKGFKKAIAFVLDFVGADEKAEDVRNAEPRRVGGALLAGAAGTLIGGPVAGATAAIAAGSILSPSRTMVNNTTNETKVEVDARGADNPQAVGDKTAEALRTEGERRDRQTMAAFSVAMSES